MKQKCFVVRVESSNPEETLNEAITTGCGFMSSHDWEKENITIMDEGKTMLSIDNQDRRSLTNILSGGNPSEKDFRHLQKLHARMVDALYPEGGRNS